MFIIAYTVIFSFDSSRLFRFVKYIDTLTSGLEYFKQVCERNTGVVYIYIYIHGMKGYKIEWRKGVDSG